MMETITRPKFFWLFLLFSIFTSEVLNAQERLLEGTVVDQNNEPIIGASIIEKGTNNGTITNLDGEFSFQTEKNSIVVISYMGYITQEIKVKNQNFLSIILKEDQHILEEVVVVGYGTLKKSDMTGAISSVDVKELSKRTTTSPAEALQGKIAGVSIRKSGGNAGSGVQVRIRGIKTFGSNEPLYIIDGFPGNINSINPQDIASMEVLKDGAAAAIYGSVAANGVVIITTKNGKKGETKVEFSSYTSFTEVDNKLDLLDAKGYKRVHKMMYENWNKQAPNSVVTLPEYITKESSVDTDWQNTMMRPGLNQNYMVSIRGGGDKSQFSLSYNHSDEKGIFIGNKYRQDNARAKIHAEKYIFSFDANLGFRYINSKQPTYSFKEMYMLSPLVPITKDEEEYGFGLTNFDQIPNNRNIAADWYYQQNYSNKSYCPNANIAITAKIADGISFKTRYSYIGAYNKTKSHTPKYIADLKSKTEYPYNDAGNSYYEEQVWENIINFNRKFGKHSINAVLGSSITSIKKDWSSIGVEGKTTLYKVENGKLITKDIDAGFLDGSFTTIDAGKGGTYSGSGSYYEYNRASFFARCNYNYRDRYLVQGTVRYDGSSKFGKNSRWGIFPSVAVGWRISEEDFFPKSTAISNLKLRASWGQLGNENALGYYDFQSLISIYNNKYQGYVKGNGENAWPGSIARGVENKDLKWETTDTKNVGLDYGLFNNKLNGSINYYHNETRDLLITKVLAPSSGLANPILNVGKIRNSGIEIELNLADKINDFEYNIGVNFSTIKNKVISLADESQVLYGSGLKFGTEHFPTQTKVGKPMGSFYLYKTDGIFQTNEEIDQHRSKDKKPLQPYAQPGDIKFIDTNKDGVIDDDDKVYCGSGIPKFEANLNLGFSIRGMDCSIIVGSAWGNKIYNANKYFYEGMNCPSNFLASTLKAWTPNNKNTNVPRAVYNDPNGNIRESQRFLEDGDYIRLRQVQLGYTLPNEVVRKGFIEKIRFYISGENLYTWTKYSGIDPEFSRDVLNTGVDTFIYPFTHSYTIGAQIIF